MFLWTFFLFFRMNSSLFISIIDAHTSYQHSLDSFGHFTNETEICWVIPVSLQGFLTGGHFFPPGEHLALFGDIFGYDSWEGATGL